MGRWVLRFRCPAGACLFVARRPLPFAFLFAPIPFTPLPRRGRGRPKLFHARLRPLHPRAEPTRHLHDQRFLFVYGGAVPAAKERGDRGRGTSAFEMVLSPGAGIANAAGACLSCRLPTLPLLSFSAPHFPHPFPVGKGIQGYFMQGASPLASPGLNPRGTGKGGEPRTRRLAPALPVDLAAVVLAGGLSFGRLPTPPLVYFFCPYPSAPFPGGGRGDQVISCKGLRPLHPRG